MDKHLLSGRMWKCWKCRWTDPFYLRFTTFCLVIIYIRKESYQRQKPLKYLAFLASCLVSIWNFAVCNILFPPAETKKVYWGLLAFSLNPARGFAAVGSVAFPLQFDNWPESFAWWKRTVAEAVLLETVLESLSGETSHVPWQTSVSRCKEECVCSPGPTKSERRSYVEWRQQLCLMRGIISIWTSYSLLGFASSRGRNANKGEEGQAGGERKALLYVGWEGRRTKWKDI